MAKQSGLGQRLYIEGMDVSGDVGAITGFRVSRATQDVTGLDKSAMERILALADGELGFNLFYDPDSPELEYLGDLPTADAQGLWLLGTTRGDPCWAIVGKVPTYDWARSADGALLGTVQLQSAAGVAPEPAELLVAKTTHESATDEDALDGGASSSSGGVGFLQHFDAASGTVEYDIEDSADNDTFANLLAFADVETPYDPIAERVEVAGTVERYVRASTNGTFTDAVFAMAFRRRASTDNDAA